MSPQFSFRLGRDVVGLLDRFAKDKGSSDFESYMTANPRKGLAVLVQCMKIVANGGEMSRTTKAAGGVVTVLETNDPQQIEKFIETLPADYDGQTVEVSLQRKFGRYKTLCIEVPVADSK